MKIRKKRDADNSKHHFAGFIRHAELGDKVKDFEYDELNFVDPPLTPQGELQAEETGKYLKKFFEENKYKFDKFIIESSPWLGCMMTAERIGLELADMKKFGIQYRASELLFSTMYEENPMH